MPADVHVGLCPSSRRGDTRDGFALMSSRAARSVHNRRWQHALESFAVCGWVPFLALALSTSAVAASRPQWSPQRSWTTAPAGQSRLAAVAPPVSPPVAATVRTEDPVPFQPSSEPAPYAPGTSAPQVRYDAAGAQSYAAGCADAAPAPSCGTPYYGAPILTSTPTGYGFPDVAGPGLLDQTPMANRLVIRPDYLYWWGESPSVTPLVTTADAGTPPATAGVLGEPTTDILSGGGRIDYGAQQGGRISAQLWFDPYQLWAIEGSYLGLARKTARFSATSDEYPILARPYFDTGAGAEAALLVAHPDFTEGSITVSAPTEFMSIEALLRRAVIRQENFKADVVAGWRYARLDEALRIEQFTEWTQPQPPIIAGTTRTAFDLFDTKNTFNGAEIGVEARQTFGRWSLEALAKLGLGHTRSVVEIEGQTLVDVPGGGTTIADGALLAQETNIDRYTRNDFAVLPELGLTLGFQVTSWLQLRAGYTFLYWSNVVRPARQIDRNVSQLPPDAPAGALRPAFEFDQEDYWLQGANFGAEFRF